eukprot:CAMPEP_0113298122 /NCGR_PEP_ID=MMETSP0010_2-20120614/697_1 /TAXON_ID=216773 ORGANISM="Corethron hystrix, Strain 308" /NCGR_SAMPLE_ID=MMETSP0010_2 /ASSEMBLY_ACC=CAM_ASM_000155 /LENGTH=373 /DNA_ID=CAMNT_0000151121 /DNA_START=155 /DNA_END=1276 /DNA_ORIENTATION=+ /assembly_acc=CAM_ASM_000155
MRKSVDSRSKRGGGNISDDDDRRGGLAVKERADAKNSLPLTQLALAGAFATMIGDTTMHPIDCIKTLQQSNAGIGINMVAAAKKIFRESGAGGFYSGLGTYVTSDGAAGSIKFATYEALKNWLDRKIPENYHNVAVFGCAAAAFVASSVVLVPGELIKQRLQMGQISSISEGIATIWKSEGILGFFHGYAGVCYRDIPYTMLELGLYENFKRIYLKIKRGGQGKEAELSQFDEIVAAAVTGGITGYITNPLDTIKTKLMTDTALYNGFGDCFWKTVKENGWVSLFQGGAARVAWLMPFTAIYLPVYDYFKRTVEQLNEMASPTGTGTAFIAPPMSGARGIMIGGRMLKGGAMVQKPRGGSELHVTYLRDKSLD